MAGAVSRMSSIRRQAAIPLCNMLVTQPKAIIGQLNITRYEVKATKSPTVISPATTSRLPCHSAIRPDNPKNRAMAG